MGTRDERYVTDVNEMTVPALRARVQAARPRHSFNDIPDRTVRLERMLDCAHTRLASLDDPGSWAELASGFARFPRMSPGNIALILDQHPAATWVASHHVWGSHQRVPVERGIAVLIPTIRYRRLNGKTVWDGGKPVVDEIRHRPATVWDYTSTAGARVPPLWEEPGGPREGFLDDLRAAAAAVGFAVEHRRDEAPAGRRVLAIIHGQDDRQRAVKLATDLGAAAGARTGAELFAYALCAANGMAMTVPGAPGDPQTAVTDASVALRRILQRTTFRWMR